jgi:hypothetical protein
LDRGCWCPGRRSGQEHVGACGGRNHRQQRGYPRLASARTAQGQVDSLWIPGALAGLGAIAHEELQAYPLGASRVAPFDQLIEAGAIGREPLDFSLQL